MVKKEWFKHKCIHKESKEKPGIVWKISYIYFKPYTRKKFNIYG